MLVFSGLVGDIARKISSKPKPKPIHADPVLASAEVGEASAKDQVKTD